jgi:hypothetical protein
MGIGVLKEEENNDEKEGKEGGYEDLFTVDRFIG